MIQDGKNLVESLVNMLQEMLVNGKKRESLISRFQGIVWNRPSPPEPKHIWDILANLAYDLEFYVADPHNRSEDPSYYGDERLEEEIRSALRKLKESGFTSEALK